MTTDTQPVRSRFSIWLQAVRPFSYTAHIVPIVVGAMLALYYEGQVMWALFPVVVVCSLLFHTGTNLLNDYFDYRKGVDQDYTYGSSKVVFEGLLTARQVMAGGWVAYIIGIALGFILIWVRGLPMFYLGLVGFLGGVFYTAGPIAYKYHALGDFLVFALMGPLMVIGSYFALTGSYEVSILYVSLPVGFLVAAILASNNYRDIAHDTQAGIKTFASVLGPAGAKVEYFVLVLGAYLAIVLMVVYQVVELWALLVFVSLPSAWKNLTAVRSNRPGEVEAVALIDQQTAQVHLQFGILLVVGLILGAVI
ncbi:MAG: 1,4-dihydroxy-2-naphthoate octaprenyltransferase [Fidelibacterota bacterium]|nr:MAG: 1,4-dihydroxy-2-naphthoate octaprenyltransferase [Candidatus Neomarinimicrobiota bacterium]